MDARTDMLPEHAFKSPESAAAASSSAYSISLSVPPSHATQVFPSRPSSQSHVTSVPSGCCAGSGRPSS